MKLPRDDKHLFISFHFVEFRHQSNNCIVLNPDMMLYCAADVLSGLCLLGGSTALVGGLRSVSACVGGE